jgi:hypothetical protein
MADKVVFVMGAGSCGAGIGNGRAGAILYAHAAVFLAPDDAKFINGVVLPVDGG